FVIIRCVSSGSRVTRLSDWTIGAPMERLGTKCPSMTSTWILSAPAFSASATCSPKRAKSAARIDGASLTDSLSMVRLFSVLCSLSRNHFVACFEDLHEFLIPTRDFGHSGIPSNLLAAPVNQRIPEAGSTDSKADEARHARRGRKPFAYFLIVFAASQDDAADTVAACAAGRGYDSFAVFAPLESFDLPDVRFHSGILELLDGLGHQPRPKREIVGSFISLDSLKLSLLCRDKQLKHEAARAFVAVQILRQSLQT